MDGIIFDLDGTLWDSTEAVACSWNKTLEENTEIKERVSGEKLKAVFGKPLDEILDILFPGQTKDYLKKVGEKLFHDQHEYLIKSPCKTYDGVIEGIKELSKSYPLYIVSNCQAGYIEVFLEITKLGDNIRDHTCPGDTGEFKAANIKRIMNRNQLKKVIYVGDTMGDKAACDEAEIPMIHASYGFGKVEQPFAVIQSFSELLTIDYKKI